MSSLPLIPLPIVAGPTASGKTGLAVALAKRLGGEVVSADSMQVYEELFIGTARPGPGEMQGIPHHLMGFLPLTASYSVAQYVQDAHAVIRDIHIRGQLPIVCGGTGLYIGALADNLQFTPDNPDAALRRELRHRAETEGGAALLKELEAVDPETASRLHENDSGRIIRALELVKSTGLAMSEQLRRSRRQPTPYAACYLLLDARDRQVLYDRIDCRVDLMVENGLLDEAKKALSLTPESTAVQAIGYKELQPYFDGVCSLEEALENLKRQTRRYAKRQLSWFRRIERAHRLYIEDYADVEGLADEAVRILQTHLSI